jgi:hypothetical protein
MNSLRLCNSFRKAAFAATLLALIGAPAAAKRKDDVIVFKNGDRLTGEIKRLENGQLYFKNSSMYSTVGLDWTSIEQIYSNDRFIVQLTNGERLEGNIEKSRPAGGEEGRLVIKDGRWEMKISQVDLVSLRPEETTFWHQLTGSFDLGFSYAQATGQTTLNTSTNVRYQARSYDWEAGGSANFSEVTGGERLDRREAYFTFNKYLARRKKWSIGSYLNFLSSDEQSLDLRTTVGGALGYRPTFTNRTNWFLFGGAVLNRERFQAGVTPGPEGNEVEGLLGTQFSMFRFTKSQLNTTVSVFPSFTTPGRVRFGARADYRIEIINNLTWTLSFYDSYDSRPPQNAKKNDLGITVGIGWTF